MMILAWGYLRRVGARGVLEEKKSQSQRGSPYRRGVFFEQHLGWYVCMRIQIRYVS